MYGMFETHLTHGRPHAGDDGREREVVVYRPDGDRRGVVIARWVRASIALVFRHGTVRRRGLAGGLVPGDPVAPPRAVE